MSKEPEKSRECDECPHRRADNTEINIDERRGLGDSSNTLGESTDQSVRIIQRSNNKSDVDKIHLSNSNGNNVTRKFTHTVSGGDAGTGDSKKDTESNNVRINGSNIPSDTLQTGDVNTASGAFDDQVTSTQASDPSETLLIPAEYDGDLQRLLEKRYREMTRKNHGKDTYPGDQDDSISTSETRQHNGDPRSPSAGDSMSNYHHLPSHDGLPAFPAPPGYMNSAPHHHNAHNNAELTADGAGFVMEQDQSAAPPSFEGPQHPEQPEVSSNTFSDHNGNHFLRPTRVIYQEVTVPVPVQFPVHEGASVPVEQLDSSVASSADTVSESPNFTYGERHISQAREIASNPHHLNHQSQQPQQKQPERSFSSSFASQGNGGAHGHLHKNYNDIIGSKKEGHFGRKVVANGQEDAPSVNFDPNEQSMSPGIANFSPYELQYSPVEQSASAPNQLYGQQDESFKSKVNSLMRTFGKPSERSPQSPVSQQVQLNAPIAQMTPGAVAASFLPQSQVMYEANSPPDTMKNILSTQVNSGQRHTRIPLTPEAIVAAASGTRQRLPVFIKSNSNDKLAAPSMPRAHLHTPASSFDQETVDSKGSFSSPDSPSAASGQVDTTSHLQTAAATLATKDASDYGPIPLGLPVEGLLLRRQQLQQRKHKHEQHLQVKTSQSDASVQQPVFATAPMQHLPSPPGPPSPHDQMTAGSKPSLAQRLTAKILAEQLLDFERSGKSSVRVRRDAGDDDAEKKDDQFTASASRYYGHPFDGDNFSGHIGGPLFQMNPDYHTGSSRRRSQQVRRGPRRNINPTGAESSKSYGILGSGNFEVIRGGIYKDSDLDNHQEHTQGGSNRHHHRHHHNNGGDDYDDASNKKYIPFDPHGEDDDNSRDPVFGFQGYDNFQLASNQEEDLRKQDDKSTHPAKDHASAASISVSSVIDSTSKNERNSLIDVDQDLIAIA